MIDSLIRIIETLVTNINKNVVLIAIAMILIFLLGTSPTVNHFFVCIALIVGMAIIFTVFKTAEEIKVQKHKLDQEFKLKKETEKK